MNDAPIQEDSQLTRESLNGQAHSRLCRWLKAGRFAPGEKLKLRDLAAEMGISPTPVREALARLISEQALEQVGHHSVRVPVMDERQFDEVRELRLLLEGRAAAGAAQHASSDDVARLEEIHQRMAALSDAGDAAGALAQSEHFHMGVYRLARMPVLQRMIESLWLRCGPLMRGLEGRPLAKPRKQHAHHLVLRGLRRGDPELARQGIVEEVERTTQAILDYLREQSGAPAATPRASGARRRSAVAA